MIAVKVSIRKVQVATMSVVNRDSDYAIRALVQLAGEEGVLSVAALAERCGVPVDYLRKIMQKLCREDIVESTKGAQGGYRLTRSPCGIGILAVVEAVQGPVVVNSCFRDKAVCENTKTCLLRNRLSRLQDDIEGWLADMNVGDLVDKGGRG